MASIGNIRLSRRRLVVLTAATALATIPFAQPGAAWARPQPTPTPDGTPTPSPTPSPGTSPRGFTQGGRGYLWERGRFVSIAAPGATGTLPFGINARGQIVGAYDDAAGVTPAFLLEKGTYTTIDHPDATGIVPAAVSGRPTDVSGTAAFGINDRGQIVGTYVGADNTNHGFLLERGNYTRIDVPGAAYTTVFGINNRGQMTLQAADASGAGRDSLLDDGTFTPIAFPGDVGTTVHKIDDRGQVVGVYADLQPSDPPVQHGFLLNRGEYATFDVPVPGVTLTGVNSSNTRGQIVGYYLDPDGVTLHGFVYDGRRVTPIDAPGAPAAGVPGATPTPPPGSNVTSATSVYDINERGHIVGARLLSTAAGTGASPMGGMSGRRRGR